MPASGRGRRRRWCRLGVKEVADQAEMMAGLSDLLRQRHRWLLVYDNAERPERLEGLSIAFLGQRTGSSDQPSLNALAELLGDLPLELEEAAAYLEEAVERLDEYPELVRDRSRELFGLDQPPPKRARRSAGGDGKVDTTWALVWHFDAAGNVDRVVNLSGDQHQVDAFFLANFPLKPLPKRLVG